MKFNMLALDSRLKQGMFGVIVISLIFLGTSIKVDLPSIIDTILDHFIVKIVMLLILLAIGQKSLPMGIIFAILYILLSERIVDAEIKNIVEINKPVEKIEAPKEESK